MKNICFVGLYGDKNLGDPIIAYCTETMFVQSSNVNIKRLSLSYIRGYDKTKVVLCRIKNKIAKLISPILSEKIKLNDSVKYFKTELKDQDLIIVVGGGIIKYKYQDFWMDLTALLKASTFLVKPIVFNAVGVEGYDISDRKCRILKQAMHLPALKYISTRDDIDTLQGCYFDGNPHLPCEQVADPAVWASEIYGITKDSRSEIIGIGVIRSKIFIDNGIEYSESKVIDLYVGIAKELINRGEKIELFTNGVDADNITAQKVKILLQQDGIDVKLCVPNNDRELLQIISSYKAIIASRMHACIIAYSLLVPAVGLVWNDKLLLFGRNINAEENFITNEKFNLVSNIVEQLYRAIEKGYDQDVRQVFRDSIRQSIRTIKDEYNF